MTGDAPCASFTTSGYFNLAPGCVMQTSGDQTVGETSYAITFTPTNADQTVTVTNSAEITMNLGTNRPEVIHSEGIMRFMGDIALTVNGGSTVTGVGSGIQLQSGGKSIFEAGLKIIMPYLGQVAVFNDDAGKVVAGFSDFDETTPSTPNGKTVQIRGDIFAFENGTQNFIALANNESYLEGALGSSGT